jgi:hypothetical protein
LSLPVDKAIWVGAETLDPTGVPGHHRPIPSKQLKCQPLRCGSGRPQARLAAPQSFFCDKAARLPRDFAVDSIQIAAKTRRF